MKTTGMIIIAFGKSKETPFVFIHTIHCINDLRQINAIGIAGKDIAPLPAPYTFDKPGFGKTREQLTEIFVRYPEGLNEMMG
jgi:hypothetical protein